MFTNNRLIIVSVYCLMIGHPGFIFAPDGSIKGSRSTDARYKSEESGEAGMVGEHK